MDHHLGAGVSTVLIDIDGDEVPAVVGQSLLAAMVADGRWITRLHPVTGEPRGGYCGMGVCFECECVVDGRANVRACMTVVDRSLRVRTGVPGTGAQAAGAP